MTKHGQIDNTKAYFVISEDNMPQISIPSYPPSYRSLQNFQDAVNENTMVVPGTNTDLGYAALAMNISNFKTANGGTYIVPISSGGRPIELTPIG